MRRRSHYTDYKNCHPLVETFETSKSLQGHQLETSCKNHPRATTCSKLSQSCPSYGATNTRAQSLLFYRGISLMGRSNEPANPLLRSRGTGGKRAAWGRRTSNHPRGKSRTQHQTPWGHSWAPCSCLTPDNHGHRTSCSFRTDWKRTRAPSNDQGVDSFVPSMVLRFLRGYCFIETGHGLFASN